MKITVIGTGYVGLIAGLGFADFGHEVICLDMDHDKIKKLKQGECPIYEPGAELLLSRNILAKRIHFTADYKEAIQHGEVVFLAVGTPEKENGDADLSYVFAAAESIAANMQEYKVIVDKSTVPVGTAKEVAKVISDGLKRRGADIPFDVVSNPEFLREGKAVHDFTNPDRIVIGVESERAAKKMREIYRVFERSNKPILETTTATAEMIKYASNAFLATKIAFINEMAVLCEQIGANVLEVAAAMGKDGRISPKFLHPGPGYGGSCFPKDTKAIAKAGRKYGAPLTIVESVISSNEAHKVYAADKIKNEFPKGCELAVLGLAFKAETDDVRESPAIAIIKELLTEANFRLRVYDPQAMEEAKKALGEANATKIQWSSSAKEAIENCDAIAVLTEWVEFRSLDFEKIQNERGQKKLTVFDLRNVYQKSELVDMGIKHIGTGVSQI